MRPGFQRSVFFASSWYTVSIQTSYTRIVDAHRPNTYARSTTSFLWMQPGGFEPPISPQALGRGLTILPPWLRYYIVCYTSISIYRKDIRKKDYWMEGIMIFENADVAGSGCFCGHFTPDSSDMNAVERCSGSSDNFS